VSSERDVRRNLGGYSKRGVLFAASWKGSTVRSGAVLVGILVAWPIAAALGWLAGAENAYSLSMFRTAAVVAPVGFARLVALVVFDRDVWPTRPLSWSLFEAGAALPDAASRHAAM
jgi:hypothetical protein